MSGTTEETWRLNIFGEHGTDFEILTTKGVLVVDNYMSHPTFLTLAEAQRVVTCVNACAGIPNSVLVVFTQPGCNILAANTLANEQINKYSEDIKSVTERCQQLERALANRDAEIEMLRERSLNQQDELNKRALQHADFLSKLDEFVRDVKPFPACML